MTTAPFTLEQTQRGKSELGDYTEFYSHLAMQARRASRVALVACAVALISIVSAILAQLRPPILLRVQDGKVSSLDGSGVEVAETATQQQPDNAEKLAFVNTFLGRFVNIDPLTVKRDTTLALNQMTYSLRQQILRHPQIAFERMIGSVRSEKTDRQNRWRRHGLHCGRRLHNCGAILRLPRADRVHIRGRQMFSRGSGQHRRRHFRF